MVKSVQANPRAARGGTPFVKVGLVLESFDPQKGGLEQWTWQFATRLLARGHEVHVVACRFADPGDNLQVIRHPVEPSSSPWKLALAMETTLRRLHLDLIHDMGCGWHADIFHPHGGSTRALHEHNLLRIPRWRQIRFWREKRYRERVEIERRQHQRESAKIVAVSNLVRDHFRRWHEIPPNRLHVIPNGVDPEHFSPVQCAPLRAPMRRSLGCSDEDILFLLVAHNLLLKNADSAIRAFSRLRTTHPAARLVLVGGRRPKPYLRLVEKLGLQGRITFIAPTEDVRSYYAAADIHLHPTWYDPCSLVALEALACGKTVITTHFNGVSEMMTDGKEGFLLHDPADLETLTNQMRKLCDPELRTRMSACARQLALTHTLDQQIDGFLDLYQEISTNRPKNTLRPA